MRSRLRMFLAGSALLCASSLHAVSTGKPGDDVAVLLFRTEAVQQVQLRTQNASVRLCPACAVQHGPVSLDLHVQGSSMLDSGGRALRTVKIDGQADVTTGGGHHAQAAGRWQIEVAQGTLHVRIEITRESYVAAVLAAEASPSEPTESLKALAVTARSFAAAVRQRHEGGLMCDTTHCQALRLGSVPQAVRDAVWSTSGETLWLGSKQVPAYFSQHCGGVTEDAAMVWGGQALPWLTAHVDPWCVRTPSQWRASLPEADVRRALAAEGFAMATPILEIVVLSRDRSGRVQEVQLRAASVTRTLRAATLRFALNRTLGWNQMRSDRYQVRRIEDHAVFEGTGYGHGVGLCQAGAAAMAHAGKNYREILHTYFPGTAVRVQAQDAGWQSLPANGFILRSTIRDAALQAEAVRAYADAATRWGLPAKTTAAITVFPSTETFRQGTGQPGWELAVTQGSRIATQPANVLRAHGGSGPVFRHEILHSFVEAEASPSVPLWLREGLVAVLNGETCSTQAVANPESTDAALRGAASLMQSQQAHASACALTKRFVEAHGISGARARLQHP